MASQLVYVGFITLILLCCAIFSIGSNYPACGTTGVCDCKLKRVNCSDRTLKDFPENIPEDTILLYLSNNVLHDINRRNLASLKHLFSLYISNNLIRKVRGLPPSLQNLYGQDNAIQDIYGMLCTGTKLNLREINLSNNNISSIPNGTFANCTYLDKLYLNENRISQLYPRSFSGLTQLTWIELYGTNLVSVDSNYFQPLFGHSVKLLGGRNIESIEPGTLNFTGSIIRIKNTRLRNFPADVFGHGSQIDIVLINVGIVTLSPNAFDGISTVSRISITNNDIVRVPGSLFKNISILTLLSLKSNRLEELPDNFLASSQELLVLELSFNRLKHISNATFAGLLSLEHLYLFQNQLISLAPDFILRTRLKTLYIFNANISSISRNDFRTANKTLENLYMHYNPIQFVEDFAFDCLAENAKIYMSMDKLKKIPLTSNFNCSTFSVGENVDNIKLTFTALNSIMGKYGFNCSHENYDCTPCPLGTYGDQYNVGCQKCPAGGFYQDKIGQMAKVALGIGCKYCNKGTFVSPVNSPGKYQSDCDVCPTGTNKTKLAMFRACSCLDGYYRRNRFGPCYICPSIGINCTAEYQQLMPGYWWTWDFYKNASAATLDILGYKRFSQNILNHDRTYNEDTTEFNKLLPKALKCAHGNQVCLVSDDGVESICAAGYEEWMCSKCASGYYSWFESCYQCPDLWKMILEILFVLVIICIFVGIFIWDLRNAKSLIDILISRFKIVLSYYQITGALLTSFHDINWAHLIPGLANVFKALEFNIFKLLAKPSCYVEQLKINIYIEFWIGVVFCSLVVMTPLIIYTCKIIFNKIKLIPCCYKMESLKQTRANCYLFVLSMLFISYLSVCGVIFSLMPVSCQPFCIDEKETKELCVHCLRSDYSIDCGTKEHSNYTIAAYFGLIYVIGFPFAVLILLKRHITKKVDADDDNDQSISEQSMNSITGNIQIDETNALLDNEGAAAANADGDDDDDDDDDDDGNGRGDDDDVDEYGDCDDINNSDADQIACEQPPHITHDEVDWSLEYPLYIRFLIGSYKKEYFYWEIVELVRKVVQTVLVELYGTEDLLTLAATIALSTAFIGIHAYCRPMKNQFEQVLQMLSLVATFLNLLAAVVLMVPVEDTSGHRELGLAVFIIILNVSVILIALGKSIITVISVIKSRRRRERQGGAEVTRDFLTILTDFFRHLADVISRRTNTMRRQP